MITSMTGYGRGEDSRAGFESLVEIRSLNHRFLDMALRLPKGFSNHEESIKEIVRKHVSRGRINVAVSLKSPQNTGTDLRIDVDAALAYKGLLESLREKLAIEGPITIDHLLHFSEVLTAEPQEELPEQAWECVQCAVEKAIQQLNTMRAREGVEIARDLRRRIAVLQEKLEAIETRSVSRRQEEFDKLYKRVRELIDIKELDQHRLELEVAILADRVDVSEECTRFQSHNTLFLEALDDGGPAGRKLNFLLQEMNREANTIGAKTNDTQIAHLVVELKEEVEKLREQVQNIE